MRSRLKKWLLVLLGALILARAAMFIVPWLNRPKPRPYPHAPADAVDRFADARFGLFIHWGPASITGKEIGWSRGGTRPVIGGEGEIPVDIYDNLYKEFSPSGFDAHQWTDLAKAAGMCYLVFTTKHHDGFCMFDTRQTDYRVTNSPLGRDVTAEVVDACRQAGLLVGLYYSFPDWRHPDYLTQNHSRYTRYMTAQIDELCTHYGPLDLFWFDVVPDGGNLRPNFDSQELFLRMRAEQPRMLINDRLSVGDFQVHEGSFGDYASKQLWESCIQLGTQWSYKPDDQLKSADDCIRSLVTCAGSGGNLLLGIGPMPDGSIESRQADILRQVGDWLSRYGDAIYRTRRGPIKPRDWGTTTQRGLRWYVHVLDWSKGPVLLDTPDYAPVHSRVLTGGTTAVTLTPTGILIDVPSGDRNNLDTIVELDVMERSPKATSTRP